MPIDSAEDRRAAAGVGAHPLGPAVTPNAGHDGEWRQQAGYGYSGILVSAAVLLLQVATLAALACAERRLKGIKTEKCAAYQKLAEAICSELAFLAEQYGAPAGISNEGQSALDKAKRAEQGIVTERTVADVERVRAICFEIAKVTANV